MYRSGATRSRLSLTIWAIIGICKERQGKWDDWNGHQCVYTWYIPFIKHLPVFAFVVWGNWWIDATDFLSSWW